MNTKKIALYGGGLALGALALAYLYRYSKVNSSADTVLKALKPSLVGSEFSKGVEAVAKALNVPPSWLIATMWLESSINAKSPANYSGSGAVGLIGFMPATATWLGTSAGALYGMTAVEQLYYVQLYFEKQFKQYGRPRNFYDFYSYVFYPRSARKGKGYVLGSEVSQAYAAKIAQQNRGIDLNKSGEITKGEFDNFINKRLSKVSHFIFYNPFK